MRLPPPPAQPQAAQAAPGRESLSSRYLRAELPATAPVSCAHARSSWASASCARPRAPRPSGICISPPALRWGARRESPRERQWGGRAFPLSLFWVFWKLLQRIIEIFKSKKKDRKKLKHCATILDEGKRLPALSQDGCRPGGAGPRGCRREGGGVGGSVRRPRLRPGLYEAVAAAVGRVVSGRPYVGDMALLREDAQSKVRVAIPWVWVRRALSLGLSPAGREGALRPLFPFTPAALGRDRLLFLFALGFVV